MTLKLLLSLRGSVMTKQHRSFLHFPPSYLPNMPSYLLQCSSPFSNLPLSLRFPTHECSVRPAHWPMFDSGMNFAGITQIPVPSSTHHHRRRKSKPLCSSIYSVLTDWSWWVFFCPETRQISITSVVISTMTQIIFVIIIVTFHYFNSILPAGLRLVMRSRRN